QREIQLRSVLATVEAKMDLHGILGADPEVRNGFNGITVTYKIDADATRTRSGRSSRSRPPGLVSSRIQLSPVRVWSPGA
ncbi:MAG: hypothetical protein ACRDRQ_27730, partial [Pseudonocardiaceae bacterium]